MDKKFEKILSQIISTMILLVFLLTMISIRTNIWILNCIWSGLFIISWISFLIFTIGVLIKKETYGISIFIAIMTAIGFAILSVPALLMLGKFIPLIPINLSYNIKVLDQNSQVIIYNTLMMLYSLHLIHIIILNKRARTIANVEKSIGVVKENNIEINKEGIIVDGEKENLQAEEKIDENLSENSIENDNVSINNIENSEKNILETENNKDLGYNNEKVVLVEELTDEDLDFMESGNEND